jgi:hypothetical protein
MGDSADRFFRRFSGLVDEMHCTTSEELIRPNVPSPNALESKLRRNLQLPRVKHGSWRAEQSAWRRRYGLGT